MNDKKLKHSSTTGQIIRLFYDSYNKFGFGFNQEIYKNSFAAAIRNSPLKHEKDKVIDILYETDIIGQIILDFVVDQKIIVLITSSENIEDKNLKKLYNFLKVSDYEIGILLNYGIIP